MCACCVIHLDCVTMGCSTNYKCKITAKKKDVFNQPVESSGIFFESSMYNKSRFRCSGKAGGLPCRQTAILFDDGRWELPAAELHGHEPDPLIAREAAMLNELNIRRTTSFASSQSIYDQVAPNHPPEIRARVPFTPRLQTRMNFWENQIRFPPFDTYNDAHNFFQHVENVHFTDHSAGGRVVLAAITSGDGVSALAFGDPSIIQSLPAIPLYDNYDMDFSLSKKILPDLAGTSYVLHVSLIYQKTAYTMGYCYFNNLTADIVRDVCDFFRLQIMPNAHRQPDVITTIHDWRFRDAIEAVWPGVEVKGTFYSLCMIILNQAELEPGINLQDEDHQTVMFKLLDLALLPVDQITPMFVWIRRSLAMGPVELQESFNGLMHWFSNTFILGLHQGLWSNYREEKALVNVPLVVIQNLVNKVFLPTAEQTQVIAFVTLYAKSLKVIAESHANLAKVVAAIHANNANDIFNARLPVTNSPRADNCIIVDTRARAMPAIRRLWDNLDNNIVSLIRFLCISSRRMQSCFDLIKFQGGYNGIEFEPWNPDMQIDVLNENAVEAPGPHYLQLLMRLTDHEFHMIIQQERAEARRRVPEEQAEEEHEQAPDVAAAAAGGGGGGGGGGGPPEPEPEPEPADNERVPVNIPAQHWGWRCARCFNGIIGRICRPCNCICLCVDCANELTELNEQMCPLCNQRFMYSENLYFAHVGNDEFPLNWTCGVCLESYVSHIFGCKHTVCLQCVVTLRRNGVEAQCPFCRTVSMPVEGNFVRVME